MARLLAFGGNNGRKALAELDAVDLEAIRVVSAWGVSTNGHTERVRPTPCPREHCGGSVLTFWGERACILCARAGGSEPLPAPKVPYGPSGSGWRKVDSRDYLGRRLMLLDFRPTSSYPPFRRCQQAQVARRIGGGSAPIPLTVVAADVDAVRVHADAVVV